MGEKKRWVVEGFLEGGIFIPDGGNNLPAARDKADLTRYAFLEQDMLHGQERKIFLGLEIPIDVDYICVAFQEIEAFVRALAIEKNVPISVEGVHMTDKPEKWPQGIEFLKARDFPICTRKWAPVDHFSDPKNRVRLGGRMSGWTTIANLGLGLERRHEAFSSHDNYESELVKDYLAGLDVERSHSSLAMLYYFKVLERVGEHERGNLKKGAMTQKTIDALVSELSAQLSEADKAKAHDILRWRHRKSEAHLVTEGVPTGDELRLCKKMAHLLLLKRTVHVSE
jgi:hypothetical protein